MTIAATRTRRASARTRDKARRYLTEGRVHRVSTRPGLEVFRIDGDTGAWHVTAARELTCDCPVTRGVCSHVTAVAIVVGRLRR